MIIVPGYYIGEGKYQLQKGVAVPIICSLEIDNRGGKSRITGYWSKGSGSKKTSVNLFISKESATDIKDAVIEFGGKVYEGSFNSIDSVVNGVFIRGEEFSVVSISLIEHKNGIRVIGSFLSDNEVHFYFNIHNKDPVVVNSNVLSFQKRA